MKKDDKDGAENTSVQNKEKSLHAITWVPFSNEQIASNNVNYLLLRAQLKNTLQELDVLKRQQ